jgi:hypothetical protein
VFGKSFVHVHAAIYLQLFSVVTPIQTAVQTNLMLGDAKTSLFTYNRATYDGDVNKVGRRNDSPMPRLARADDPGVIQGVCHDQNTP